MRGETLEPELGGAKDGAAITEGAKDGAAKAVALIAAFQGEVRLIDNMTL